jgi:hypothetical protein
MKQKKYVIIYKKQLILYLAQYGQIQVMDKDIMVYH